MDELFELDFLSCTETGMDAFTVLYEELLAECKATGDKETARKMQGVLFRQAEWLMLEWMKAKKEITH